MVQPHRIILKKNYTLPKLDELHILYYNSAEPLVQILQNLKISKKASIRFTKEGPLLFNITMKHIKQRIAMLLAFVRAYNQQIN